MRWYGLMGLLLLSLVCEAPLLANPIIIGTPEQPTIEGGFIHQVETYGQMNQKNKNIDQSVALSEISDEFDSDQKIKKLLTLASHQNKLAYVLQKAEQMKLPATVALIPMVESHYQTDAISPKGATGAWQLMPATAKDYGLESEKRENFTASTNTALQLLKNLHQQFGNWTLAFAAYNAGTQRVSQVLQQHPQAQFIHELNLPLETQHYVYRLKTLYRAMAKYSADTGPT